MLETSRVGIMTSLPLFKNTFILRRPTIANFYDIIKVATMFIKNVSKDSKEVNRIWNYLSKKQSISVFHDWYNKKFWFSLKRSWSQQNSRDVSSDLSIFLHLLWVRYNCAEFHHSRICATDFRELLFCPLYHPWALPKVAILNRFKVPDLMVYSTCFFAYLI